MFENLDARLKRIESEMPSYNPDHIPQIIIHGEDERAEIADKDSDQIRDMLKREKEIVFDVFIADWDGD